MKSLRRFGLFLWLALVLAVGQHAGLMHGLAHPTEKVAQKQDPKPLSSKCEQCSLCAQLTGLVGAPAACAPTAAALVPAAASAAQPAPAVTRVVFRSRAPPVLL